MISIRELNAADFDSVKQLFLNEFSNAPWKDNWNNKNLLNEYLKDVMGSRKL